MSGASIAVALAAQVALLAAYALHVRSVGRVRAGRAAWAVTLGAAACALGAGWLGEDAAAWALTGDVPGAVLSGAGWGVAAAWLVATIALVLLDAFFGDEPLAVTWRSVALPGLLEAALVGAACAALGGRVPAPAAAALAMAPLALMFALAVGMRGELSRRDVALLACVMVALGAVALVGAPVVRALALVAGFCAYALVTGGYARLRRGYEGSAERFQQEVLSRQYDEIRAIYLDMRGWRHDYHNHLQVMKAELAAGELAELSAYLDELEADLDRVDTYVKSGNLMVDAILNSKLSLAERAGVDVTCKAVVPDALTVDDVDLCVILGNLLDNAIEACEPLAAGERWLRVYVAARGGQLYASVQNSAAPDPSFNQRNYITEKRGNHGLGMKRVAAVVDKYEGYLNLANEPGVFAAEVSLPL